MIYCRLFHKVDHNNVLSWKIAFQPSIRIAFIIQRDRNYETRYNAMKLDQDEDQIINAIYVIYLN